ncbi:hypothetical protein [uncultured Bacteroides sp.]|uniref:hypothetical protein n=1 Tax=uncultured Bacteroides sp. TaxID=162156 RepID=UPI0025CD200D|nr:hypothetical protein [uncultured Bacteroides sp.]
MKRLIYLNALLCAAALAGCSNEELMENGAATKQNELTLTATTGTDTRTAVDANYNVSWSAGDAFYAFGTTVEGNVYSSTGTFTLKSGEEGKSTSTFEGTVTGEMSELEYAVYPLENYTPSTCTLTFPATYTYPVSNAPMFGKLNADKNKVEFTQLLGGLMRIQVSGIGNGVEGTLKLSASGITGTAVLTPAATATLAALSNTGNEVTLSFTTTSTEPLILDIPVPAGTYSSGITATLQIGTAEAQVFHTTNNFEVTAGIAKEMRPIHIVEIDGSTISFSQTVADAAAANKALEEGVKNITIESVAANGEIAIPSTSTAADPVTINIASTGGNEFTVKGASDGTETPAAVINVPTGTSGTLNVTNIEHVELNGGSWTKVTSSTGANTLEIKDGTVIDELVIEKGGINIAAGAEVKKITLQADASIKNRIVVAAGKSMEINVGKHTLTLENTGFHFIGGEATLTLIGDATGKGKITDNSQGIAINESTGGNFTMKNIEYTGSVSNGILIDKYVSTGKIAVENSTMNCKYYCFSTNASMETGSGHVVTLKNSTFTALETGLMFNVPGTVTATQCTFIGGWQGAFLRGGKFTFDGCTFNLSVSSSYGASNKPAGATSWGSGNQAPSAALTIGNRSSNTVYNCPKVVELKNGCAFSVQKDNVASTDYPSVYIDANPNQTSQTVTFTYDETSGTNFGNAGSGLDIRNTTGQVTVNSAVYNGPTVE